MKTIEEIWTETLELLQKKMSRSSFETWIKGLSIQKFDTKKRTVTINAENEFTRQWLETRLKHILEDAIHEVTGEPYVISFAVRVKTFMRYSMEQMPTRVDPHEEHARQNSEMLQQVLKELQSLHQRFDRMETELTDIRKEIKAANKPTKIPRPLQ